MWNHVKPVNPSRNSNRWNSSSTPRGPWRSRLAHACTFMAVCSQRRKPADFPYQICPVIDRNFMMSKDIESSLQPVDLFKSQMGSVNLTLQTTLKTIKPTIPFLKPVTSSLWENQRPQSSLTTATVATVATVAIHCYSMLFIGSGAAAIRCHSCVPTRSRTRPRWRGPQRRGSEFAAGCSCDSHIPNPPLIVCCFNLLLQLVGSTCWFNLLVQLVGSTWSCQTICWNHLTALGFRTATIPTNWPELSTPWFELPQAYCIRQQHTLLRLSKRLVSSTSGMRC